MSSPSPTRLILHIRLDSFFASIEEVKHPEWSGRPIVVATPSTDDGSILSLNRLAKRLGFRSGQAVRDVVRLCPLVVAQPPDLAEAEERSRTFFALLCRFARSVEPRLLDEAFIDLSDPRFNRGPFATSAPIDFAASIQRAVEQELGLTASIGIGRSKTVAWAASSEKRPNGLTLVAAGDERAFLYRLPLNRLLNLGDRTSLYLISRGLTTIGQLAAAPAEWLEAEFGNDGPRLAAQARGLDAASVESIQLTRTLSRSLRFETPMRDSAWITSATLHLAKKAFGELQRQSRLGSMVTVRLVDGSGRSHQHRQKLRSRSFNTERVIPPLRDALDRLLIRGLSVRSIVVEFGQLETQGVAKSTALWNSSSLQTALRSLRRRIDGVGASLLSPPGESPQFAGSDA